MLTGMEEKRPSNWRWWLLAAGLGFVHFIVVVFVEISFGPLARRSPSNFPRYQPSWFYYAFMNVFTFPLIPLFRSIHLGPKDGAIGLSIVIFTCFVWGGVWAEPFRWKFGWRPWRFSIRELFVVTAAVAGILGWIVWLNHLG